MNNIYYINLDRRVDREKNMINQFKKHNIENYTRISAVDYRNLKNLFNGSFSINDKTFYYKNNCDLRFKKRSPQTLGTIACVLSHLKTLYIAKQKNLDYVIIMEDDISLDYLSHWELSFNEMFNLFPKDWNIIQLHTISKYILKKIIPKTELFTKKKLNDNNNFYYLGTAFYIISKKGINEILDKHFDHLTNTFILKGPHPAADGLLYNINSSYIYNRPLVHTLDKIYESDLVTGTSGKYNKFGIQSSHITHKYYKRIM